MTLRERAHKAVDKLPDAMLIEILDLEEKARKQPKLKASQDKLLSTYLGCLKDSPSFNGDPVKIQRAMRREWK